MKEKSIHVLEERIVLLEEENRQLKVDKPAVEERLNFLQTLLNSISMPVFYKDVDGVYKDCNPSFSQEILGVAQEEVKGKSVYDFPSKIPPDLARTYHQRDLELITKQGPQVYESKVKRADGTLGDYIFCKAPMYAGDGSLSGIVGVMLDITERKSLEAELVDNRKRIEILMEATHSGIVIHEKGKILDVNPGMCKMIGLSSDEIIGKDVISFFPKKNHPPVFEAINASGITQFDSECFKKDGSLLSVSLSGRNLSYEDRIVRVVELIDLTERKKLEREREVLIQELKAAIDNVKTLQGMLPICSYCKKIRNDSGYWEQVENYFGTHSELQFSHSLCPVCVDELYGKEDWYQKRMKKPKGDDE